MADKILPQRVSTNVIQVVFCWDQPGWVGWVFLCSSGDQPFLVGLVDQLFNPVEMVENDGY